ncbi:hypothetical protein PM082_005546 [Marasmius tenuissimus]|nr:hypothetical protein PM082_005546 [Marasmius tenuissimus]
MTELDRESSAGSLWDQFPSEDEQLFREVELPEDDPPDGAPREGQDDTGGDEDGEKYEAEYDSLVAELSQAKCSSFRYSSPEPEIDPEDDISVLIAAYDISNLVSTQPSESTSFTSKNSSEETLVASSSSNASTKKRSRDSFETAVPDEPHSKLLKTENGAASGHGDSTNLSITGSYYAVAHSPAWQPIFDELQLPFGVLWEISRLVSVDKLSFDRIEKGKIEELARLKTNSRAAPSVEKILLGKEGKATDPMAGESPDGRPDPFAKERLSKFPYTELDREEDEFNKGNTYACLGCLDLDPWYGGKVVFRAKVKNIASEYAKNPKFKIILDRPELGASYRFSRRHGSSSFIRLKVPRDLCSPKMIPHLVKFLIQPVVVCGSVYRLVLEKDKTVFLYRTNELVSGLARAPLLSRRLMLSLEEFMELENPIELNKNQAAAKWAARFALGFSTSAPGVKLLEKNIIEIDDIVSPEKSEMTDGSGFINQYALRLLYHKFNWDEWPTAIQVRVAGAKGMLLQHPEDTDIVPRIWIRPSQTKIKYESRSGDEARLVIDILRSCHSRTHCSLGAETIINLAENGVPAKVFCGLLDSSFQRMMTSLTTWEGDDAMFELWSTLERLGGVMAARAARAQPGLARVKGHSSRDAQIDEDEDGLGDVDSEETSVAWWNDEISGQPSSLEETVMGLLDFGFTPGDCAVLLEKLGQIITTHIRNFWQQCKIEVPMSCTTFIQPDPRGFLDEGQVYFKSAHRNLLTKEGLVTDTVIGDVLVTRHPCKLPTDVQKWEAVDCPQLRNYTGIIFFSTKGSRRAADYLGGGDYDGDKALLIYDPVLVDSFDNADIKFADPRDDIEKDYFLKHTEKLSELLEKAQPTAEQPLARTHALQGYLLGGLKDLSLVGQYSNMHDYATYTLGYSHPETIRLAHMFCRTLDGAKTGLTVLGPKVAADRRRYYKGAMHWKRPKSGSSSEQTDVKRPKSLSPFIMDEIAKHAEARAKQAQRGFQEKRGSVKRHVPDPHLIAPWNEARELAERWNNQQRRDDMKKIEEHVIFMYKNHRDQVNRNHRAAASKAFTGAKTFTDQPIETRQNQLREMSREFAASPSLSEVSLTKAELDRLRASFAYLYDSKVNKGRQNGGWTRFPWDVAMRELGAIKAAALGPSKTVRGEFYQKFSIKIRRNRNL